MTEIKDYVAGYIRNNPFEASVYMEFCDRGSLDDMLKRYKLKLKNGESDRIPESFIWHTFCGLADALGYLQTGQSHVSLALEKNDREDWMPLVHCDIKPNNIFIRSRDTPGSTKHPYMVLSDFGLIQSEAQTTAFQGPQGASGTFEFHAPELAFDPFPSEEQHRTFKQAGPHTCKSDVWALACCIFCMCQRDELAHMDRDFFPLRSQAAVGRIAKIPVLAIRDVGYYSDYLARTIAWAGEQDHQKRPNGWELVVECKAQYDLWHSDPNWRNHLGGALPEWATTKHTIE
ncbi:kinase-like domain-containing protein [Xylariaceae sp. FL1272]|nr:kinase-like domain-containing protein [Xylariaceae sp. FL1272]